MASGSGDGRSSGPNDEFEADVRPVRRERGGRHGRSGGYRKDTNREGTVTNLETRFAQLQKDIDYPQMTRPRGGGRGALPRGQRSRYQGRPRGGYTQPRYFDDTSPDYAPPSKQSWRTNQGKNNNRGGNRRGLSNAESRAFGAYRPRNSSGYHTVPRHEELEQPSWRKDVPSQDRLRKQASQGAIVTQSFFRRPGKQAKTSMRETSSSGARHYKDQWLSKEDDTAQTDDGEPYYDVADIDCDDSRTTKTPTFSEQELQSFSEEKPSDVIAKLMKRKEEFLALLTQGQFSDNALILTLRIVSKICDLDPFSYSEELNIVLCMIESSLFLSKHLARYLVGLSTKPPEDYHGNAADDVRCLAQDICIMLKLLQLFLQHKPRSYAEVGVALILLEKVITAETLNNDGFDPQSVLMIQVQQLKESYDSVTQSQKVAKQFASVKPPPNNFRDIPIFPESTEIRQVSKPFLRKNITQGKYKDVEHYLDVQFRLLREDFIAPLREGVTEYLSDTKSRVRDIRIYRDVVITDRMIGDHGFVYTVKFDVRPLKRVRWESSKRLIYGSFVCLTKDNFQHILCASVENRDPKVLAKGKVDIRFLTETTEAIEGRFIMAESAAYFEAYRHVLQGLQQIDKDTFSFKKYIVDVTSSVDPPLYLRDDDEPIMYDLRALVVGSDDQSFDYNTDTEAFLKAANVPILNPERWPTAKDLHLDESQKGALQTALTKEFAVIQGPPGTGKTYIGLKIIEILLQNRPWNYAQPRQGDASPILVVCYTNHALDQFLEGIIGFGENNVVRVGGRSSSELLESRNLSRLKRNRERGRHMYRLKHDTEEEIQVSLLKLDLPKTVLLNVKALCDCMSRLHFTDLCDEHVSNIRRRDTSETKLLKWLNVVEFKKEKESKQNMPHNAYQARGFEGLINVEDEGYRIQLERQIDNPRERKSRAEQRQALKDEICRKNGCGNGYETSTLPVEMLQNPDVMSDDEAGRVESVWSLRALDRWRLYRFWVRKFIEQEEANLSKHRQRYQEVLKDVQDSNIQEEMDILSKANVIGMTTTGAAKCRPVLQRLGPRIVVVEEAAEVLEAHIVTTLTASCQHLILIGDHQQLKPNPTVYRLAKLYNLDTSLFERMINNGMPCQSLTHQHRMRPEMSTLMKKHFYQKLEDDDSVLNMNGIRGMVHNMFFIDHQQYEDEDDDNRTRSNQYEAEVLVELCRYLLRQGYDSSQITVLTTYTGQLFCFRRIMDEESFGGVRVCVVDNYQGEENDIILLSLVRSNEEGSIGFMRTSNRVCVALSRARMGFYCIGNASILKKTPLWRDIIATLDEASCIGSSLPLVCQNHPNEISRVTSANDFKKMAPLGGCIRPCEYRLPCGHVCASVCHSEDPEHEEYFCEKPCTKRCRRDIHECTLICDKDCLPCKVKVPKLIPECGHTIQVTCDKFEDACCTEPCPKTLPCCHSCQKPCSAPCTTHCVVQVEKTYPKCGHTVFIACSDNPEKVRCKKMVSKTISKCGHDVEGYCYDDSIVCQEKCEKLLRCGHPCPNKCGESCETSRYKSGKDCEVTVKKTYPYCNHTKEVPCCKKGFLDPCDQNCEKVLACGHRCPKKCYESCPRDKEEIEKHEFYLFLDCCQKKCEKKLPCGHPCPNKCGEPCPTPELSTPEVPVALSKYRSRPRLHYSFSTKCTANVQREFPDCGHSLEVLCHQSASAFCPEPCDKELPCGHRCPNACGEPCFYDGGLSESDPPAAIKYRFLRKCRQLLEKKNPACGHTVQLPCSKDVESVSCPARCEKILGCGHQCPNKCGEPCPSKEDKSSSLHHLRLYRRKGCEEIVNKKVLPCNHVKEITCWEADKSQGNLPCSESSGVVLECDHKCTGSCVRCKQETEHITCAVICSTKLLCGHDCRQKCSEICSPECIRCKETERRDGRAPGLGLTAPDDSTRPTACNHNVRQGQCMLPCSQKLRCGHFCIGVCGEPCPPYCIVCNRGNAVASSPQTSIRRRETFIYLPDCKHICETRSLDNMVKSIKKSFDDSSCYMIRYDVLCPKCKEPIRHCPRYDDFLRAVNEAVTKAKRKCLHYRRYARPRAGSILKTYTGATASLSFAVGRWMRCRQGHVFCQEENDDHFNEGQHEPQCVECAANDH